MNIQDFLLQLEDVGNLKAVVTKATLLEAPTASKKEFNDVLTQLGAALKENAHKEAVKVTCALFRCRPEEAIGRIRRGGLFRASRYGFKCSALRKTLEAAVSLTQGTSLRQDKQEYLESALALQALTPHLRALQDGILKRMSGRRKYLLKTLLAIIDKQFSHRNGPNKQLSTRDLAYWSPEDIAEAFSYILHLARNSDCSAPLDWLFTDPNIGNPQEYTYESLLIDALHIRRIHNLELEIDGMPYGIRRIGNDLHVDSIEPSLNKSIHLGYIQTEIQINIRVHGLDMERKAEGREEITLRKVCDSIFEAGFSEHIAFTTNPSERFIFSAMKAKEFFTPIVDDRVYDDEKAELIGMQIDGFTGRVNLMHTKIDGDISIGDMLKVQRFFRFISHMINRKCDEIESTQRRTALRAASIIMVVKREKVTEVLQWVVAPEKIERIIELLTLKEKQVIDIQYTPFIESKEYIIIPPSVAGLSNLPRNSAVSNGLGKAFAPKDDPMVKFILSTLQNADFMAREEFDLDNLGENKLESDIICWRDSKLFVFECKHFFHPSSSHELRTGFEHLKTAAEQLTVRQKWLSDKENQKALFKRLNWKIEPTDEIHTCIITASRVFNGHSIQGHPVRHANEINNVVASGVLRRSEAGKISAWSFWAGEKFHANDLIEYLQGRSILKLQLDKLEPYWEDFNFGQKRVRFKRYVLDLLKVTPDGMRQLS